MAVPDPAYAELGAFRPRSFAATIPLVVILERSEESRGGIVLLEDDMDEKRQAQRRRDLVPPPQKFHYVRIAAGKGMRCRFFEKKLRKKLSEKRILN